jgi:hypothetical protein
MSGYSAHYSEEELLALGAVRVFDKPFRLQEVLGVLEQLCARPPGPRGDPAARRTKLPGRKG